MFIQTCQAVITGMGNFAACAPQAVAPWWSAYVAPVVVPAYSWAHPHIHHLHAWWRW